MRRTWEIVVLALALSSCSQDLAPNLDVAASIHEVVLEQSFAVVPPAPPAEAAAPALGPCAAGWHSEGTTPVVCEPWPTGVQQACASDSAHFVSEAGCVGVGRACPLDGWPDALPAGRPVRFVRQGAAPGGDGSRALPFATVAQALAVAGADSVLALGAGSYELNGPLPRGTVLIGACVAQTTLTLPAGSTNPAVVHSQSAGVEVRNVRVSGAAVGLAVDGPAAQLGVEDVVVDGAAGLGCLVQGRTHWPRLGHLRRDCRARRTRHRYPDRGCRFIRRACVRTFDASSRADLARRHDRAR